MGRDFVRSGETNREEIRVPFRGVDSPIADVKKVFLEYLSKVRVFRETAPNLAVLPEPMSWAIGATKST